MRKGQKKIFIYFERKKKKKRPENAKMQSKPNILCPGYVAHT